MKKNITVLSFSGRSEGNCAAVSNYLLDHYSQTNVRHFIIHDLTPCGKCNYECLVPHLRCSKLSAEYVEAMDAACGSDLIYYVLPNYCGFPCAAYFSFNEHSVGYFNLDRELLNQYMAIKKRFIIISNTETDVFKSALQQQTTDEPEILYLKSSKYKKKSIAGDLLDSEEAQIDLKAFLDRYIP